LSYTLEPEAKELPRRIRTLVVVIALGVCALATQAAQFSVDAVKAAYLFRFAQYVEWPEAPVETPFVFAVTGAEGVAVHLEKLLNGMTVNGRRAVVRRVARAEELEGAQVLYVGADAFSRTRGLRGTAIKLPILVVTDDTNGLDGGAVINFVEVNRNLRFEISLNAADRSGLKINSALLSVASRVERRPQGAIGCQNATCRVRMAGLVWERR
jgi:hypothetical protein